MNTPEHESDFRCATFDPAMQAAIPPDIRAKMDADRARAQQRKTVWLLEAPTIPGYYLRQTPRVTGKLGTQTELGTMSAHEAMRFSREQDAAAAQRIFQRLCPDLFPGVYPYPPRPIEHGWNRMREEEPIHGISMAEVLDKTNRSDQ